MKDPLSGAGGPLARFWALSMGQQQSNSNDYSRRRNSNQADGFVTESSDKVAEKYKIDVSTRRSQFSSTDNIRK